MTDVKVEIVSGVIGAVTGGISGAVAGWLIAPTQAEREERGRRRVEGRQEIAAALSDLSYQVIETRGKLFRMEGAGDSMMREKFLDFAGHMRAGASSLGRIERWRIERNARALTGKLIWHLAEIVPAGYYSDVDEASIIKATADTRTSNEVPLLNANLARKRPTDPQWDAALKAIDKMKRSYPV